MDHPAQASQSAPQQQRQHEQQGINQLPTLSPASQSQSQSQANSISQAQANQPQPKPSSSSEAQGVGSGIGLGIGTGMGTGGASTTTSTTSNSFANGPTDTASKPADNPPPPLPSLTVHRQEDSSNSTSTSSSFQQQAGHRPPPPPPPPPPSSLPLQNGFHHGSPNGHSLSPSTPSPSMSNHQPPVGPPRQPVGYPSPGPGAYPSPGMPNSSYGYPPVTSQGPVDQYRASPTGIPPNPLALPSMRTFADHPVQQQQQQQPPPPPHHVMSMGAPMAPGPPPMGYYLAQTPYNDMRFALPPNLYDPRMQLSGGRHKKEIKRRTKTGCLTCRKRRIKFACRGFPGSLEVELREASELRCHLILGGSRFRSLTSISSPGQNPTSCPQAYHRLGAPIAAAPASNHTPSWSWKILQADPAIFQCDETHPTCNNCKKSKRECLGYDPIFKQQPSPANLQPAPNSQPTASTAAPPPPLPPTVPSSTAPPYTTQPPPTLTPTHYTTTESPSLTYDASLTSERAPDAKSKGYEPSPYIDPALENAASQQGALKAEQTDQKSADSLRPRAKNMKVDELIALGGTVPPFPTKTLPRDVMEEVTKIYYEIYVPGLCQFFETQWYNFKSQGSNPITIFLDKKPLLSLIAEFLHILQTVSTSDAAQMTYSGNLETRVVWALATLAYTIPQATNSPRDDPLPEDDATELRNRLCVFETLLSGDTLTSNPLILPPKNADVHRKNEYQFWYFLAEFLLQPDPSERERLLNSLRNLLEGRENRDVLYSLAILREFGPRFGPGYASRVEPHLDENEPRNKIHVATQFINNEASNAGGTTNVVRRFAFIATKAFINPGVNIKRKS